MKSRPLPPYSSRHMASAAMKAKFPKGNGKVVRVSSTNAARAAELVKELTEAQTALRQMALFVAGIECDLKALVNYNDGLEIPGVGIVYWTAGKKKRRVKKVNWMRLAKDLKISETTLNKYRGVDDDERRLFLHSHAHTPEGVMNLGTSLAEADEIDLEDDL